MYNECWDELNNVSTFCRENHGSRRSVSSGHSDSSDFSFQSEGTDDNGPESRAGYIRVGHVKTGRPNLTALVNGEAAKHVVDGQYQVPQQIQFGDLTPIGWGTGGILTERPTPMDYAQEPWVPGLRDSYFQDDTHAGRG
jgi:hypothetical protein